VPDARCCKETSYRTRGAAGIPDSRRFARLEPFWTRIGLAAATRKDVKRLKIGAQGCGDFGAAGWSAGVCACSPDDCVAVIDLKSLEMTGKIAAGKQPDGLAWAVRK
jgi:hypothetical protein